MYTIKTQASLKKILIRGRNNEDIGEHKIIYKYSVDPEEDKKE